MPISTYRLQLNHELTFDDARELIPYLNDLGVESCYVSPILKARAGSMHGYDVVDHSVINPEIGSFDGLEKFAGRLKEFGMGLVVDIVPNHMCVSDRTNWRWQDVLENGPSSPQSQFFDIDWHPPREDLANKVLLPQLGDQYGCCLEGGTIQIEYDDGAFAARYYDNSFPLAPRTWTMILSPALQRLKDRLGGSDAHVLELESVITALGYLPLRTEIDQDRIRERQREKEIIKRRIASLSASCAEARSAIAEALLGINGNRGDPTSFDRLEELLAGQAYRLSFWRVAADEINYRRFFDVNELAAIRTEDPAVFQETHAIIFDLVGRGWITGLRVDHPDGLFEPARYFTDLRSRCMEARGAVGEPFYVIAEKIVAGDEELRTNWDIAGTTGYAFLNLLNGLFIFRDAKAAFRSLYERWTERKWSLGDLTYESKNLILRASMSSELNVLARRLDRICQQHRHLRDFTLETLRFALGEIIACFPVYRTYSTPLQAEPSSEDRRHIVKAIEDAKARNPAMSESVFDSIASLLLLQDPAGTSVPQKAERRLFVMRFQQLTGPVMAKGVEDTAFYRYYPLASINEVGGELDRFGVMPSAFHVANQIRLKRWTRAMTSTSTHDTKRSEDVRARINVLSEIPIEWQSAIRRWSHLNEQHRAILGGKFVPDRNAEYLLYQTLVGMWPPTAQAAGSYTDLILRIQNYMEKAMKEAKVHTSWINPDEAHDQALRTYIAAILEDSASPFLSDFRAFMEPVVQAGMCNSLAQVVLKVASPGVPDCYQGCETWNFSLVDPDSRRPVDYAGLRSDLQSLLDGYGGRPQLIRALMSEPGYRRLKLFVTATALRFRRDHAEMLVSGRYAPIRASGSFKNNIIAFVRVHGERVAIVVCARFLLKMHPAASMPLSREMWGNTVLQVPRHLRFQVYRDLFSGKTVGSLRQDGRSVLAVADVFDGGLPVALLTPDR